ncbi:MAG: thermonuclease family protein [Planctomycetota bacterium]|nr:thermonuclease family protein [Planctomycetota bacterium]
MPLGPDRPPLARLLPWALAPLLLLGAAPWARAEDAPTAPVAPAPAAEAPPKADPLVIGRFPGTPECIVDGDTVRLPKGNPSVRVLGIDSEELFKQARDRKAAEKDFAAYAKAQQGDHPRPRKYGTPAGEAARDFARALMKDATGLRLERDAVDARAKGTYGRILAHVFIEKPSGEVHLAEALVRAGHSPYFTKYGRSRRFDAAFRKAQDEAREAKRGIWSSEGPGHYPDYEERLRWWNARADQITRWRAIAGKPNHVTLGAKGADKKLATLVGKEVVLFGLYDRELPVSGADRRILLLSHERGRGIPLVFFDPKVIGALDMDALGKGYVTVRGKLTLYKDRPQIVVESPTQISTK